MQKTVDAKNTNGRATNIYIHGPATVYTESSTMAVYPSSMRAGVQFTLIGLAHVELIAQRMFLIHLTGASTLDVKSLALLLQRVVENYETSRSVHLPIIRQNRVATVTLYSLNGMVGAEKNNASDWYEEFAKDAFNIIKGVYKFLLRFDEPTVDKN